MTKFLSLIVPGVVSGGLYAIIGTGLVLGYQTAGIFNFGYGAMAFASAYLYYQLNTGQHLSVPVSAVITVVVFAPLLGLLLDRIMLRRLATAPVYARIVGTIGLIVALPNLVLWIVDVINDGGGTLPTNQSVLSAPGLGPVPPAYWQLLKGVTIDSDQVAILAAAAAAAFGLWILLRRTRLGLLMRADVDRRELATLRGISPARVSGLAWVLTSMLAALVGVLIVPLFGLDPNTFTLVILASLAAVVAAGFQSLPLVFVGGLVLGVIQNLVAGYAQDILPPSVSQLSGLRSSVPFILTFVGLIVLGGVQRRRTRNPVSEDPAPDHRVGMSALRRRLPWAIVTVVILIYTLIVANSFWASLVDQGLVFAIIFLSFVVVTGVGGMVSLAQATLVTGGGFMAGYLVNHKVSDIPVLTSHGHLNFGVAALVAAVAMAIGGMIIAFVLRRLGTLALALATLAVGLCCELIVFSISGVSNGSTGWSVNPPSIGSLSFGSPRTFSLLLLALFGLITLVIHNLTRSASGRALFASRSSEFGARTTGISPDKTKVLVFGLSAAIAGFGGALYVVTASPFTSDTAPTVVGLVWLALVVTWGIRRPGGALLAGIAYAMATSVFQKITDWNHTLSTATQDTYFLPILFGIGAIALAREPDGILAKNAKDMAARRRKRMALAAAGVQVAEPDVPPSQSTVAAGDATASGMPVPTRAASNGVVGGVPGGVADTPAIELRGIVAGYGEVVVLHDADLVVPPGSIVALFGANGAGKSTLCKVAAGLVAPSAGRVLRRGVDVTTQPVFRRTSQGLLLAPEGRGIFPGLSVEENLSVWLQTSEERDQACEHFPILRARRKQLAGLLSGGEQQMLALVPALVRPPDILIADEPTLGLAPRAREAVYSVLEQLGAAGVSVLLVEEKVAEVSALADTIAFMRLGRIDWVGPSDEVDEDRLTSAYLGGEILAGEIAGAGSLERADGSMRSDAAEPHPSEVTGPGARQ